MRRYGAKTGTMALFLTKEFKNADNTNKSIRSPLIKAYIKNILSFRDHKAHQDNRQNANDSSRCLFYKKRKNNL